MGVRGNEFGTVTGRKRRCGWLDVALLRYAVRLNGLTELFLTKLDVLSGFGTLKICTGYRADGQEFDDFPPHQSLFHRAQPVYEQLDGWNEEIDEVRSFEDLPKAAQAYVRRIEALVEVPVSVVSVGPAREQSLPAA
jgi:adenylosuccinate synthase